MRDGADSTPRRTGLSRHVNWLGWMGLCVVLLGMIIGALRTDASDKATMNRLITDLDRRVSALEAHQMEAKERMDRIQQSIDRVDRKVDELLRRDR